MKLTTGSQDCLWGCFLLVHKKVDLWMVFKLDLPLLNPILWFIVAF